MKTRNGFVSNSSSSSFIIGVALITNKKTLCKYLRENKVDKNSYKIIQVKDINDQRWDITKTEESIVVPSFKTNATIPIKSLTDKDWLFYSAIENNEGDYSFSNEYDCGALDYDIDLDFFGESDQLVYNMFNNPNIGLDVNVSDVTFGAGRNG